jgi:hypothetical protein
VRNPPTNINNTKKMKVKLEVPLKLTALLEVEVPDDSTLETAWKAVTEETLENAVLEENWDVWGALKNAWRDSGADEVWGWETESGNPL